MKKYIPPVFEIEYFDVNCKVYTDVDDDDWTDVMSASCYRSNQVYEMVQEY